MLSQLKNSSNKDFLKKFGHLRPSTYDINSPNYKENFNLYFGTKRFIATKKDTLDLLKTKNNY